MKKPVSVEEYLSMVPEPAHGTLQKIRSIIRSAVPAEATEVITYSMPGFRYKGALIAYAAFADHCSLFPMSGRLVEEFASELAKFSTSKVTIRFPSDKPPSAALIRKIVKARVVQNEAKSKR